MERPVSVTVTCWVIIALALEAMVGLLSGFAETVLKDVIHSVGSPMSFSTSVASGLILSCVTIILAALMLRGTNWARIVYLCVVGFSFLALLVAYAHIPIALIFTSGVKALVFGTLLLRPSANKYFSPLVPMVVTEEQPN